MEGNDQRRSADSRADNLAHYAADSCSTGVGQRDHGDDLDIHGDDDEVLGDFSCTREPCQDGSSLAAVSDILFLILGLVTLLGEKHGRPDAVHPEAEGLPWLPPLQKTRVCSERNREPAWLLGPQPVLVIFKLSLANTSFQARCR